MGLTGYAVRPPVVRKEKKRVAACTSAKIDKILLLKPDLVLTFSDLQAEIAAELIKNGVAVMTYNQRDTVGILAIIRHLGATVGVGDKAEALALSYEKHLTDLRAVQKLMSNDECILRSGTRRGLNGSSGCQSWLN